VFGRPHAHWGEAVHAVATLKPGMTASEAELIAHCRTILAHYKCPRTLEIREQPMPLSGANKISKAALKEELRARETASEA
jgi:long-chain acyl-CoA synthetase